MDFITHNTSPARRPREGDFYKSVAIGEITFHLCYGYYEEFERDHPHSEPIPIYPDFLRHPRYTKEGQPLVTAMQDICKHYRGRPGGDSCGECECFISCEDLFGICATPNNKQQDFNMEE